MYAKYVYNSGTTQADMLADLIAILTGETVIANLSASCNKATTELLTTISAGWTVHDSSPGGSHRVILKAPYVDAIAGDKYLEIFVSSTTDLFFYVWETWDAVAHTGTNKTANGTTSDQRLDLSNGGNLYLASSARFMICFSQTGPYYGDGGSGATLVAEYSRLQPWNSADSGYPAVCLAECGRLLNNSPGESAWLPRVLNAANNELTGANAKAYFLSVGVDYNSWSTEWSLPIGAGAKVPDGSGGFTMPHFPIYIGSPRTFVAPLGNITSLCDVHLAPANIVSLGETVNDGINDYIGITAYNTTNNQTFLVRKG